MNKYYLLAAVALVLLIAVGVVIWLMRKSDSTYAIVSFDYNIPTVQGGAPVIKISKPLPSSVTTGTSISVTITDSDATEPNSSTLYEAMSDYSTTIAAIDTTGQLITLATVPSSLAGIGYGVTTTGTLTVE